MSDADQYLRSLELSIPLREPVIRAAIESLHLPLGSRGLDVGCGIGVGTLLLAEAIGTAGRVAGLDITPEFLNKARSLASQSGAGSRTSFREGDARNLPFDENSFDWAGSIDFAGCVPLDPVLLLKEMRRVVKPGGQVFILMWSSQKLLAGFPMLEAGLNATSAGIAPFKTVMNPELHMMRALGWFKRAGFIEPKARTFVRDISSPLNSELRNALLDLFQMRWGEAYLDSSPADWEEYQRLCRSDSPDFILDASDYYAFFTYSLFAGKVP